MTTYHQIFENNKRWAATIKNHNPDFFKNLAKGQNPDFLFIGCSDSRIPLETICGVEPGEIFVHRNIGNLINSDDPNALSVIDFAVRYLGIKHIVVCGHYGCLAVGKGLDGNDLGDLENWLSPLKQLAYDLKDEFSSLPDRNSRYKLLVEKNTLSQCQNINKHLLSKQYPDNNSLPTIHAWVYDMETGLLIDLDTSLK